MGTLEGTYPDVVKAEADSVTGYASVTVNPEAGPVDHIVVVPSTADIQAGGSQQFTATGYDQNNNVVKGISFTWSVVNPDAGSIDENGLFTAQSTAGASGYVKATVDAIEGQAAVNIISGYQPNDANEDENVETPGADATITDLVYREEAAFHFANLSVSPTTVGLGESVTVAVDVTNTGGIGGSCTVTLLIDGVEEATQELMLGPGASDTVTFAVTRHEADIYEATVDGLSGSFTVWVLTTKAATFPWVLTGGILVMMTAMVFLLGPKRENDEAD